MNPDYVGHPQTKEYVAQFIAQPSHAAMLVGTHGIGKSYLAEMIIAAILDVTPDFLKTKHPYFLAIAPEKNSISIEVIRELQHFLQLKTATSPKYKNRIRRAIIIEHAEAMTTEAQNAFLKVLEEPPADTVILLTAPNQRAVLPTILSRVQLLTVHPPLEADIRNHFAAASSSEASVTQAYFLSGGLPGLMHALLAADDTHPLIKGVETAKSILQKTTFERLALVETLSKQKEDAIQTVSALQHIAQTALQQAAKRREAAKITQWQHILKVATAARTAFDQSANPKLILSNMMLAM